MASNMNRGNGFCSSKKINLSKMSADEVFELLECISVNEDTTDYEDDELGCDFDDDHMEFPGLAHQIDECIELLDVSLDDEAAETFNNNHQVSISAEGINVESSTSGSLTSTVSSAPSSFSTEPSKTELSTTFQRRKKPSKRPRSPLPEFEGDADIPDTNAGGYTGTVHELTAQSKECKSILWRKKHLQLHKNEVVFRGNANLPSSFNDLETPHQCFMYFFTQELFEEIAEQKNLYARQHDIQTTFSVAASDIRKYIGILIFMSIYRYPSAAEYWGRYSFEPIRTAMTSKQFYAIQKYLHFNDKSKEKKRGQPAFDPLYKVSPLVKHFNARFETVPKLPRLCLDEQMCATKMVSTLRQFMPAKPHRWGFKLFELCDTSGFSYGFEIYIGAGSDTILPNMPDLDPAANVLVRLS